MIERNIISEFAQARKTGDRPYLLHSCDSDIGIRMALDLTKKKFGIDTGSNGLIMQTATIEPGISESLITSRDVAYLIASGNEIGVKIMPDRAIFVRDPKSLHYWKKFYDDLKNERISFSDYKRGEYGVVGFNPKSKGKEMGKICVKFFNLAYPFSSEDWLMYQKEPDRINHIIKHGKWRLSGVTGVGSYVASRHLRKHGVNTPNVFFATSDLLVQEFIDGLTIAEIADEYEALVDSGVNPDRLNQIWDWTDKGLRELDCQVRNILDPTREEYWSPDFLHYDVNWGNVMIPTNELYTDNSPLNPVLIDPLR